jgi:hypothetical protein
MRSGKSDCSRAWVFLTALVVTRNTQIKDENSYSYLVGCLTLTFKNGLGLIFYNVWLPCQTAKKYNI